MSGELDATPAFITSGTGIGRASALAWPRRGASSPVAGRHTDSLDKAVRLVKDADGMAPLRWDHSSFVTGAGGGRRLTDHPEILTEPLAQIISQCLHHPQIIIDDEQDGPCPPPSLCRALRRRRPE